MSPICLQNKVQIVCPESEAVTWLLAFSYRLQSCLGLTTQAHIFHQAMWYSYSLLLTWCLHEASPILCFLTNYPLLLSLFTPSLVLVLLVQHLGRSVTSHGYLLTGLFHAPDYRPLKHVFSAWFHGPTSLYREANTFSGNLLNTYYILRNTHYSFQNTVDAKILLILYFHI